MRGFAVILLLLLSVLELHGQQPGSDVYPEEAVERMRHLEGAWILESDVLGPDGNVVETVVVYDTLSWLVPDRILGLTSYHPETQTTSKGMWFYDTTSDLFYLISVNGLTGSLWTMSGTLDEWTITSQPKRRPNGSEVMIRFKHFDVTENEFRATMEISVDGGETWRLRDRQRMTRQP